MSCCRCTRSTTTISRSDGLGLGQTNSGRQIPGRSGSGLTYLVAAPEGDDAIKLVQNKLGLVGHTVEDLGRVSEALLQALKLSAGEIVRADDAGAGAWIVAAASSRSPRRFSLLFGVAVRHLLGHLARLIVGQRQLLHAARE